MRSGIPLILAILIVFVPFAPAANAQYIYLDTNGDGLNTAADRMNPNGMPTTVDVYLNPGQNRDGSPAACNTADGALTLINSYVVSLRYADGAVSFENPVNRMTNFNSPIHPFMKGVIDMAMGYGGTTLESHTTAVRLMTVTALGLRGTPRLDVIWFSPLFNAFTSFGTECTGNNGENTYTLRDDWFDADGIAAADPSAYVTALMQSSPNPASQGARLEFGVAEHRSVTLEVFDLHGRLVRRVVQAEFDPGWHTADWDLRDSSGKMVARGIYISRLTAGSRTVSRKLAVLR